MNRVSREHMAPHVSKGAQVWFNLSLLPNHLKVLDQITFLKTRFTSTFLEILIPIDGSYFSHSYSEVWRSTIGYLRRSNQNNLSVTFSYYFNTRFKSALQFFTLDELLKCKLTLIKCKQNLFFHSYLVKYL